MIAPTYTLSAAAGVLGVPSGEPEHAQDGLLAATALLEQAILVTGENAHASAGWDPVGDLPVTRRSEIRAVGDAFLAAVWEDVHSSVTVG